MIEVTLKDLLDESKLKEVESAVSSIDDIVEFDEENDNVQFKEGGYTNIVLSMSLGVIKDNTKPAFTLRVIETYYLDSYFKLEDLIVSLKNQIKEIEQN